MYMSYLILAVIRISDQPDNGFFTLYLVLILHFISGYREPIANLLAV